MEMKLHEAVAPARRVLVLVTQARMEDAALGAAQRILRSVGGGRVTLLWGVDGADRPPAGADDDAMDGVVVQRRVCYGGASGAVEEALAQAERERPHMIVACNSGIATQRLVRRSPCSLLVLPCSGAAAGGGRVLVPVDFTPESEAAALFAAQLVEEREEEGEAPSPVELVHVYDVPVGHHKMGWTHAEFRRRMKVIAERRIRALGRRVEDEVGVRVETSCHHGTRVARTIQELVERRGGGELVFGSRLRTPLAGLLLPDVVERVVFSVEVPVWVVRSGLPRLGMAEAAWGV